ncbi:MAG: DUF2249 domain-containing protein [Sulfurimonas sp.]|nr:DUF2249 domain-containing protein [Sulfurimonas sp.]MDD3835328.1 DUF2249 domain-containing protein [Sulfurimonas sp.]
MNKKLVEVEGTTLPFYTYEKDGLVYYEFDASGCTPPEPMVNTIRGLSLLESTSHRLVGIYFHEPFPLYERIPITILHDVLEREDGTFEITFYKENLT